MNRIDKKLAQLKDQNKKALVAYLVAGDPDLNTTHELMHSFVKSGVNIIELGSGAGLSGLVCAYLGANVTLTDMDDVAAQIHHTTSAARKKEYTIL